MGALCSVYVGLSGVELIVTAVLVVASAPLVGGMFALNTWITKGGAPTSDGRYSLSILGYTKSGVARHT